MIWAKHPYGEIREYADLDEAAMAFRDNAEEPPVPAKGAQGFWEWTR